ncbi:hypothetical protein EV361DRAFT_873936 [Lentinula raphanica]|nr:hypothetical protein EV361DRAFT_873936 [Lentinula raphanica]
MEGSIGVFDLVDTGLISDITLAPNELASIPDLGLTFEGPGDRIFTASSEAELAPQLWDANLSALMCNLAGIDQHTFVSSSTPMPDADDLTANFLPSPPGCDSAIAASDLLSASSPISLHELQHSVPAPAPVSSNRVHNRRQRIQSKPYTVQPNLPAPRSIKRDNHACVALSFDQFCHNIGIDPEQLHFSDNHSMSLFQRYMSFAAMQNVLMNFGLTRGSTWKTLALITVTYCDDRQETLTDILQSYDWRARTWNDKVAYFEWAEDASKWTWNYDVYPASQIVHGKDYTRSGDLYNHWVRIKSAYDYPGFFILGVEPKSKPAGGNELEAYTAELTQDTIKTKRLAISACLTEAAI